MGIISLGLFVVSSAGIYIFSLNDVFYALAALWCYTIKFFLEWVLRKPMSYQPFYRTQIIDSSENKETRLAVVLLYGLLSIAVSWLVYDIM